MASFQVFAKITSRKNGWLVYIKDSEQIVEFLNVIGAHNALLNFENAHSESSAQPGKPLS